ncbi:MAG: hypothetical protein JXA42_21315 [Anaerolineales bacterium]|nr:hypothetical protein [Anaerolineales bacterium]
MSKRLTISTITGGILGIVCVLGASMRAGGWGGNGLFLFALWYNRVIIGLMVGLAGERQLVKGRLNPILRGGLLGLLISAAFYLSTGLQDGTAFYAGIIYGIVIEYITPWIENRTR